MYIKLVVEWFIDEDYWAPGTTPFSSSKQMPSALLSLFFAIVNKGLGAPFSFFFFAFYLVKSKDIVCGYG